MGQIGNLLPVVTGAAQFANSFNQAEAIQFQGQYQSRVFDINSRFAEARSADAINRGNRSASDVRKQTKRLIGSQRAALAAQGVEVDSGSGLDIQQETRELGVRDEITVRNNAWREAWGYRTDALSASIQGEIAKSSAQNRANNTLATGGIRALDTIARLTPRRA